MFAGIGAVVCCWSAFGTPTLKEHNESFKQSKTFSTTQDLAIHSKFKNPDTYTCPDTCPDTYPETCSTTQDPYPDNRTNIPRRDEEAAPGCGRRSGTQFVLIGRVSRQSHNRSPTGEKANRVTDLLRRRRRRLLSRISPSSLHLPLKTTVGSVPHPCTPISPSSPMSPISPSSQTNPNL